MDFGIITNLVTALATAAAAIAAWRAARATEKSASSWRQQLLEQSRQEAARKLLNAVYILSMHVDSARSAWRFGGTAPRRLPVADGEDPVHEANLAEAEGNFRRLEPVDKARAELMIELQAARAVLGEDATDAVIPILKEVGFLFASVSTFHMYSQLSRQNRDYADELTEERQTITDLSRKDHVDEYGLRFRESVRVAEGALAPIVRQPAQPSTLPPSQHSQVASKPDPGELGAAPSQPQLPPKK